ncbi:MAG: ribonuclease H-like domain-containing protein [Candidatus Dormibacteraeota bacterium]|nr:ribonuclease H-like domain-containing protein [Candidatus Dormibacteraeota bacterium]
MPTTALRERLAGLLGSATGRSAAVWPATEPARPPAQRLPPRDFEPVDTPYGVAWRYLEVLPVGRFVGVVPPVPHAYLDTETTGLAGGTGTQAFAAAICRPTAAGLELCQLFLSEPSGEAAFLHLLQHELRRSVAIATYNGSRFDLPLVRTRWVMARLPGELEHPEHLDLLTLTRALLKPRLESCTLRAVEERWLGYEREDDLPGALVPEAYFDYLRHGLSPRLEAALEHNRLDVLSLFHLHGRLLRRLAGADPRMEADDWLALGRHLNRAGRRADGWRALRRAAEMAQGPASALAGALLARTLARRGEADAAERLLARLSEQLPREPALAIVRAQVLEWRLHRLEGAREVVVKALSHQGEGGLHRHGLERRLIRLERRLQRGAAGAPRRGQAARPVGRRTDDRLSGL